MEHADHHADDNDHADFEGLAAGYALHALEPEDEQQLAAHLLTCQSCARLVADTAALGAAFTDFLVPEPPPAGLRARILEAAAAEPRFLGSASRPAAPVLPSVPARRSRVIGRSDGMAHRSRVRRLQMRGRIAVGVLAAVVGIGVAVPVTLAVSGATKPRTSTTALAQWLLAPNAREVTLRGTRNASLAKAVMTDSGVYLVADGLAVNDRADSTYVLWASNSSAERVPMATFDVRNGSPVQLVVTKLPFKTSDVTQVAISLEPGRKAPAAPSVVVLSGMAA